MDCHTFFGNGAYYGPDLTKAWLDPAWEAWQTITDAPTREEAMVRFLMDIVLREGGAPALRGGARTSSLLDSEELDVEPGSAASRASALLRNSRMLRVDHRPAASSDRLSLLQIPRQDRARLLAALSALTSITNSQVRTGVFAGS